jgi:dTDP-4-dehydrorhamnose reductase
MSVLVLGRSGQLATHLRDLLTGALSWGRAELDLSDASRAEREIVKANPTFIVNAAAYTAVDRAEAEPALAWALNAEAAAAAARAAQTLGIGLVHISTDYVFDGTKQGPYVAGDPTRPLGVYGATKLAGELAVATLCEAHWILRTSWVFSEHGHNFLKTMLRLARDRDELRVVADQVGVPTYAGDLARLVAALIATAPAQRPAPGVYHAVGGPSVSWFEFAKAIFATAAAAGFEGCDIDVQPIPTAAYPTAAARPANSQLAPSPELGHALGLRLDWQRGLEAALGPLRASAHTRTL